MLAIIPLNVSDSSIIPPFIASLVHFGDYKNHDLLLVISDSFTQSLMSDKVEESLTPLFNSVSVKHIADPMGTWPYAANVTWNMAILAQMELGKPIPFIWLEPDVTPTKKGWLDLLAGEYISANGSGTAYLGMRAPTVLVEPIPNSKEVKLVRDDEHFVGVGVYPYDHGLNTYLWKTPPPDVPFDTRSQWETRPNKVSVNMAHRWGTINYRREGGKILCDDRNPLPQDRLLYGGEVPDVALIHGCKDGSLAALFVPDKELTDSYEYFGVHKPVSSNPSIALAEASNTLSSGGNKETNLDSTTTVDVGSLEVKSQAPLCSIAPDDGVQQIGNSLSIDEESAKLGDTHDATTFPMPTLVDVIARIEQKKTRLVALAEWFKVDKDEFSRYLLANGFILDGISRWVKKPTT